MKPLPDWVTVLFDWRMRYGLAWVLAVGIGIARIVNAYQAFGDGGRSDGNSGHTAIDFGGQWLMGRLLATGHGRELFVRPRQWEVAQQAYPEQFESPLQKKHDADSLVDNFMGKTDARWENVAGAWVALIGPSDPLQRAAVAMQAHDEWNPELLAELNHPGKGDGIGGPLYPPVHAFVMLPLALGDHPQSAYFVMHYLQTLFCFLGGFAVSVMSRRRVWWPVAASLLLVYPGCRGAVDLGQNAPMTVAILLCGWAAMSRQRLILGGAIWGLLVYKPVWGLSFGIMLLLMRQWQAALAMAATATALCLATLPIVGVQTWLHWLHTGNEAAELYNLDSNWIPLSRDVLNLPRRLMVDFTEPYRERNRPLFTAACWGLWLLIVEVTLRVLALRGRGKIPFHGPLPAMLALAAWMCTFHFMYYDAMISALGVMILLSDPRPYFRLQVWKSTDARTRVYASSFVLSLVATLLLYECVARPMRWEMTAAPMEFTGARTMHDESTEMSRRMIVGTNDRYPVDTLLLMTLWAWCGVAVCRRPLTNNHRDPATDEIRMNTG